MQNENPVERARRELGMTRRQLALASGLPYESLVRIERGYVLSVCPRLVSFLRAKGYRDAEAEYAAWRAEAGESVGAGVSGK